MSQSEWYRARDVAHQQRLPRFAARINQMLEEEAIVAARLRPDALVQIIPDADSAPEKVEAFHAYLIGLLGRLDLLRIAFQCFLADANLTGNERVLALFGERTGAAWSLPEETGAGAVTLPETVAATLLRRALAQEHTLQAATHPGGTDAR